MKIEAVTSSTIQGFVDDTKTFDKFVRDWLLVLDEDKDGVLSRDEVRVGFGNLLPLGYEPRGEEEIDGLCGLVFERFDQDRKGSLDEKKFKSFITEIMNALARGIGESPLIVVLDKGSFLSDAVQHELATRPLPS